MLKVGILGLGNCGNQLADLAKTSRNIPGLAINTSEKDIANVKHIDTFIIGDNKGAGKDRSIAKTFVKKTIKELLAQEKFSTFIKEQEVVIVASSTGGGSGSGIAPMMCHLLSEIYKNKKFILLHVLPSLKESLAAQQNTIEYLQEIMNFDATYMSYDNGKMDNVPANIMMKSINEQIIEDICVIRGDYQLPTIYTSIDEKDALKILSTKGRLQIARVHDIKEKDLDKQSIEELVINSIKFSDYMTEFQRDNSVKRTGVILNLNEKINSSVDTNMPTVKGFIGEPIEGFEHITVLQPNMGIRNSAFMIMAGLSTPDDRIEKISQRVKEIEESLKSESTSILDTLDTSKFDSIRSGIGTNIVDEDEAIEEVNIEDIMSFYM